MGIHRLPIKPTEVGKEVWGVGGATLYTPGTLYTPCTLYSLHTLYTFYKLYTLYTSLRFHFICH